MTRPAAFTQGEVTKVVKGLKAAGETVSRIEINRDGTIVAHLGKPEHDAAPADEWGDAIRARKKRAAAERH